MKTNQADCKKHFPGQSQESTFKKKKICSINGRSRLPICLRKEEKVRGTFAIPIFTQRYTLFERRNKRMCKLVCSGNLFCLTGACTDVNNYIPETNAAPGGRGRGETALTEQGKK